MTVLVVRPADDSAAQEVATWGQAILNLIARGQGTDLAGTAVNRTSVQTNLSAHDHLFWFGHGLEDELISNGNSIVDDNNIGLLGQGMAVAIACYSAVTLGADAIAAGSCDSYLGFDDEFVWQPKAPLPTELAVTNGLRGMFTSHHDIGDAKDKLHDEFDDLQDYFKRNGPSFGLTKGETCFAWMAAKNNMHSLQLLGSSSTTI